MVSDWTEGVTEILFESSFMTLATADVEGRPWASPVEFVCDEDLRFYWLSMVDARHSVNVRENPWMSFSIYDSTQARARTPSYRDCMGSGQSKSYLPLLWKRSNRL